MFNFLSTVTETNAAADQKMFYRRKSEKELNARYLDRYLSTYDSVLPAHYLREREDGTVEKVPIPPTHPERCPSALRGVKVRVYTRGLLKED